jgi:hypothetical protein
MKNLFVPYNTAKVLIKEKGFDAQCLYYWSVGLNDITTLVCTEKYCKFDSIGAPLYQQVIDWLREKHKLHILIEGDNITSRTKYEGYVSFVIKTEWDIKEDEIILFESELSDYYVALTDAINAAIKLI